MKEAYTPFEWHEELFEVAHKVGITIFSSPFDETAVDLLEKDVPAYTNQLLLSLSIYH